MLSILLFRPGLFVVDFLVGRYIISVDFILRRYFKNVIGQGESLQRRTAGHLEDAPMAGVEFRRQMMIVGNELRCLGDRDCLAPSSQTNKVFVGLDKKRTIEVGLKTLCAM